MTSDEGYQLINFITSKNQGGSLRPSDYNNVMNRAQDEFTSYLLGNTQTYAKSGSRVSYGISEDVRQKLTPLIGPPVTLTIAADGSAPYPTAFQQVDAMLYDGLKRVRFIPQDSLYAYFNSVIDSIADKPGYLLESNGFRFYPNNLGSAILSYVAKPPRIVWAYTLDANQRIVYDAGNSTDPVWYDVDVMEVIARALRFVGVNLKDTAVAQFATEIKQIGQ